MQTLLTTTVVQGLLFVFWGCQLTSLGPSCTGVEATHVIHELLLPDFDLFWQTPSRIYPYFGNLPIKRADYLVEDARRVYLDVNTSLQKGLLKSFYMFVHSMPGVIDSWLRIQIWRPMEMDRRVKKYQLVWEHRVLVDIEAFPKGIVHQFVINSSRVSVTTGDVFGWTFEDERNGPIGFDRYQSATTLYRTLPSRDFPRLGLVYEFETEPLHAVFSVAVEIFDHDVCARCSIDIQPLQPQLTEGIDDDIIPGGLVGNVSLDSDFTKSVDSPESAAGDNENVAVIVGSVLGVVLLVLVVVNVAVFVKLRKMKKDDQEAAQRRESASRRKEARTIESRPVNPRSD